MTPVTRKDRSERRPARRPARDGASKPAARPGRAPARSTRPATKPAPRPARKTPRRPTRPACPASGCARPSPTVTAQPAPEPTTGRMRLQRFLSLAGLASRREAEKLIEEGHVEVNGSIAELGATVDPAVDRVSLDGRKVAGMAGLVYLVLNKPRDVLSTRSDPEGRRTVMELLPPDSAMVMPVGRLDYHSTGLLLLTNDGELAQRLTQPDSHVAKVYRVKATRPLSSEDAERFRHGVPLNGRRTRPAELKLLQESPGVWYQVVLTEGRNRQIRRMFQALGNGVQKLCRIAIGPISLGKLPMGEVRPLKEREVLALKRAAGMAVEETRLERKPGWAVAKPRREMPGRKWKRPEPAAGTKGPGRTPRGKGR